MILNKKVLLKVIKKSLSVKWNKLLGADGYDIFAAPCGSSSKRATMSARKGRASAVIRKVGSKKISKKKAYKARLWAYRLLPGGTKQYIGKSVTLHAAGSRHRKETNAKGIRLAKKSYAVTRGKSAKLRATVVKAAAKKKLQSKAHGPRLRYASSNEAVATVSKTGRVRAKKKGKCAIYVRALNGRNKRVKIAVK